MVTKSAGLVCTYVVWWEINIIMEGRGKGCGEGGAWRGKGAWRGRGVEGEG